MSRLHPFDFAFGPVAEEWFGEIRSDGGRAARDPGAFAKLPAVEHIMAQMQTEEGNPEASEEYSRLLYVAYHFWEHGRQTIAVPGGVLETSNAERRTPDAEVACYFSLPRNLFWAQISADEPHEPADGFFVVSTGREWVILVILGLREDRQGFSQISLIATRDDMDGASPARIPLLAPLMPGGEAAGFHSIVSADELLYLVRLALISTRQ